MSLCIPSYGQIVSALDHGRGGGTAPNMHPRSAAFRQALDEDGIAAFRAVAKSADFNVVRDGGVFDVESAAFATAQRCMRLVDTDRLLWMRERVGSGSISLSRLEPPTCSPKSSIILFAARHIPGVASDDSAPAGGDAAARARAAPAAGATGAGEQAGAAGGLAAARRSWLALFGGQGAVGG